MDKKSSGCSPAQLQSSPHPQKRRIEIEMTGYLGLLIISSAAGIQLVAEVERVSTRKATAGRRLLFLALALTLH
jgi:hypothetical protein